jgi:hypothetical protein
MMLSAKRNALMQQQEIQVLDLFHSVTMHEMREEPKGN